MTRPRWYSAHPPVALLVPVEGGRHRVSWTRGRLVLHDHDYDPELDAVLGALGGEACPCRLIRDSLRTGGVSRLQARRIALLRRSAAPASSARQLANQAPVQFGSTQDAQTWALIVQTTSSLRQDRQRAQHRPPPRPPLSAIEKPVLANLLEDAARRAMEMAIRDALPHVRPREPVNMAIWKDRPGEPTVLQGDLTSRGGFMAVSLPIHWLTRVWRRGLACVDGTFVIEADAPAPVNFVHGKLLRWEKRSGGHWVPAAASCSFERRDGRWHLQH
jgi:hypothetical protein